ncbi:MAG: DNA translocase FtsK 4TM domain-containing protein [Lachnospiraceae bacterium]|nr:DNA translocase FtsK 4TM domain-containing protein [Lachnospiraceae bacterium]
MSPATRKRKTGTSTKSKRTSRKRTTPKRRNNVSPEIYVIGALAFCVLLFVSNIHMLGVVGDFISGVEFGLFGICAYIFPIVLGAAIVVYYFMSGLEGFFMKFICCIIIFVDVCVVAHLFVINDYLASKDNPYIYCSENQTGGGLAGGFAAVGLFNALGLVGAWLVSLLIFIICLMIVTEASLFDIIANGSDMIEDQYHETSRRGRERYEELREKNERRKEMRRERREQREREDEERRARMQERREREEEERRRKGEKRSREEKGGKEKKDGFTIPLVGEKDGVTKENPSKDNEIFYGEESAAFGKGREEEVPEEIPETAESAAEASYAENSPSIRDGEIIYTEDETDDMPEIANPVDVDEVEAIYEEEHPDAVQKEDSSDYYDEEDEPLFTVDELCDEEFDFEAFSLDKMKEKMKRRALKSAGMSLRDEASEDEDKAYASADSGAGNDYVSANDPAAAEESAYEDEAGESYDADHEEQYTGNDTDDGSDAEYDALAADASEVEVQATPAEFETSVTEGPVTEKPALSMIPTKEVPKKKKEKETIFSLSKDDERTSSGGKVFTEKKKVVASKEEKPKPKKQIKYRVPTLKDGLLNVVEAQDPGDVVSELEETKADIKDALDSFGITVTMGDASRGPAVTRYEMVPQRGTKVSKIVNLSDDLKMALGATDIRIEAPIPGKHAVGIEVPNNKTTMVSMYELLSSKAYKDFKGGLSFAVGKDLAGDVIVSDITKMPHVLIAGTTGSGKSVCVNTMLMSMLYRYTPADLKLILIDPKVVELSVYNEIPHLLIPVVTDPKKASNALLWGVKEMDERYEKFAQAQVRDLAGFNEYLKKCADNDPAFEYEPLPKIVIIVDELADLMMQAKNEVEDYIIRLLQKSRACGIHLVIATQRPSVDVITGLIKANVPSRIAFAVKQGVDSQTILDERGAEKLLGKGDMLFYPAGYPKPSRVQGAFVSDEEVRSVVAFWAEQKEGDTFDEGAQEVLNSAAPEAPSKDTAISDAGDDGNDVLFAEAGRFIIDSNKASTGSLQRKFRIGFNRAARIMDQLNEAGVVGPENGTKPREILMSREQFDNAIETGEI